MCPLKEKRGELMAGFKEIMQMNVTAFKSQFKLYVEPMFHPIVNERWQGMYFWLLCKGLVYIVGISLLVQKRMGLLALLLLILIGYFSKYLMDSKFGFKTGIAIFLSIFITGWLIYGI